MPQPVLVWFKASCGAQCLRYSCTQLPFKEDSLATENHPCWILSTSELERESRPRQHTGPFFPYLFPFSCVTLPFLYGSPFLVPSTKGTICGVLSHSQLLWEQGNHWNFQTLNLQVSQILWLDFLNATFYWVRINTFLLQILQVQTTIYLFFFF